jgi:acetylornithine/succinyldiaminopimelate/putrescine aminotransferase
MISAAASARPPLTLKKAHIDEMISRIGAVVEAVD